ncbi:TlpA family protein disulfide reductase [Rhabdothermincola sediminis]|uniref:TlpA family protein disulfide reductase n=1 Tax=Rhabdothermincola sediminis TaxID=2751370 RepID=UPI001AA074D9|nr:TlpA disulfide reductase family protein [Rhabdothermincola sediminis]
MSQRCRGWLARRRWWATGAAVVVVLLVAVFVSRTGEVAPGSRTDAGAATGASVGDTPPVLTVSAVSGEALRIPAAGKPTALFFSAAWCQTCVPEAQAWDRIERSFGDRLSVVVIDADPNDTPETLAGFVDLIGEPRYPFVIDSDATVARTYELASLDTTVIIDATGTIVFRDGVPTSEATLRTALEKVGLS